MDKESALPELKFNKHSKSLEIIYENIKEAKSQKFELIKRVDFKELRENAFQIKPYKSGDYIFVNSLPALIQASEHLQTETVIGVDVEYNAKTSYDGFICLIQMSTYSQ